MTNNRQENSKCLQWAEFISAYIDGQLDDKQVDRLEEHLKQCRHCSAILEQYLQIKELLAADRHECPADIASLVLANIERENLLGGLDSLVKPSSPLWVRLLKITAAAAMIALAISTIFIVMRFTNTEKHSAKLPYILPKHKSHVNIAFKKKQDTSSEMRDYSKTSGLPTQSKSVSKNPILAENSVINNKKRFSSAAEAQQDILKASKKQNYSSSSVVMKGLALMPAEEIKRTSQTVATKERKAESLAQIVPWKIIITADTPMLMLIKEQLTDLLLSEGISQIQEAEITEAIYNDKDVFYPLQYYEVVDSGHYAEFFVFADIDKIKTIYSYLTEEQVDNSEIKAIPPLSKLLNKEDTRIREYLAISDNIIHKIAEHFSSICSLSAKMFNVSTKPMTMPATMQSTQPTRKMLAVMIILKDTASRQDLSNNDVSIFSSKYQLLTTQSSKPATMPTTSQATQPIQSIQSQPTQTQCTQPDLTNNE